MVSKQTFVTDMFLHACLIYFASNPKSVSSAAIAVHNMTLGDFKLDESNFASMADMSRTIAALESQFKLMMITERFEESVILMKVGSPQL